MAENGYHDYKCKNCGAPLVFRGDLNKMACEYCDSTYDMSEFAGDEQVKTTESNWQQSEAQQMDGSGMKEMECNTCGALLVAEENVGATECPYCGNPLVIKDTFEGMNLPDGLIPFSVDKSAAQQAVKNFYAGKKLLPPEFKNRRIDEITGVYVPFWLFDCEGDGTAFYKATQERRYKKGEEEWKEIKDYAVTRSGSLCFEKVPADGSKEMKDSYMDSLEPYDYSKITPYNAAYMSGYVASKYDEDANTVKPRVDTRIKNSVESKLRSTVTGYDSVNTDSCSVDIKDGKITYCLLPLWMLSTKWNGETYTFAMNGQTGKVTGDLPVDKSRCTSYFMKSAAIGFLISAIILYFVLGDLLTAGGISIVIGLIIGAIALGSAKSSMVAHIKTEASAYQIDSSFKLSRKEDRYIGTRHEKISSGSGNS